MFDQNPPHGLGGRAKEKRAVLPLRLRVAAEPQPGFMDERGGLQCVARPFAGHQVGGETAEFAINQRQELFSGLRIALFNALEYASDAAHARQIKRAATTIKPNSFRALPPNCAKSFVTREGV